MILWFSKMLLPLVISYVIAFGLISRRPIFDDFLDGAKNGMKTVADILPTLIGLITAVGVVRASGLLDAITDISAGAAGLFHIPQELVPVTLVRLVSNSAATGLLLDLLDVYKRQIEALGGKAEALQCNVSEYDKAAEMMEYVVKTYGRVDILVNNAGITRDNLLMKMSEEDFDAVLNTNLKGAFNCICLLYTSRCV